jgi:hypothetical protein
MNLNNANKTQKNSPTPEAGMQLGIITQVVGLGLQPQRPFQGQEKPPARMVRITYELPNDTHDFGGELKPLVLAEEMPFSGNEKSKLYRRVTGIDPALAQSKGDLAWFVGKPVMVNIVHKAGAGKNTGRVFANIQTVTPVPRGYPVPQASFNPAFIYDPYNHDEELFQKLPDFLKTTILSRLDGGNNAATTTQRTTDPVTTAPVSDDEPW